MLVWSITLLALVCALFGHEARAQEAVITGHIVPHSHDDGWHTVIAILPTHVLIVGWLLTINGYFDVYVHSIYDTVVESLAANPERKFIAVEMAYFFKWWIKASPAQQETTKQLVENGQLEFIVGGWTMEDEACTTYSANIDQMTEGHQFIISLFGEDAAPTIGWQVDPFGHSNVVHEQFGLMGFNATVLDRIQYLLKNDLIANQTMEFVWETNPNLGESSNIFTHVLDGNMYCTPVNGLEWDDAFSNPPVDDKNILSLSNAIVENILYRRAYGRTNQVLFPWGCDFQHYWAQNDYMNMDKLIAFINQNTSASGVRVQYSTLTDYFNAVAAEPVDWFLSHQADFFPYNDRDQSWWTGYFTSRNALKGFARTSENVQRVAEIVHVLSQSPWGMRSSPTDYDNLGVLRRSNGETTHHDGVSGTAKPYVVYMYLHDLINGTKHVTPIIEDAISTLGQSSSTDVPDMTIDANTMSVLQSGENVAITVFNPTSWVLNKFLEVPVNQTNLIVTDHTGAVVSSDVLPYPTQFNGHCMIKGTCGHANISAPYSLFFEVSIPAIGSATYFVTVNDSADANASTFTTSNTTFVVSNGAIQLAFNESTYLLSGVTNAGIQQSIDVQQTFMQYQAFGNFPVRNVTEGAYVLRPVGPASKLVPRPYSYEVTQGRFVTQVRQRFTVGCNDSIDFESCGVEQIFRLYTSDSTDATVQGAVQVLISAGPLELNKDLVLRTTTSLNSNGVFYTDDNCFETHERVFNPSLSGVIGGNYFPMTCAGFIRDEETDLKLTFVSDRTHGATSQANGEFEMMIHRCILSEDGKGPLDEMELNNLQNIEKAMIFGAGVESTRIRRQVQYALQYPPTLLYTPTTHTAASWPYAGNYSALLQPLPYNVHLLTLMQLNSTFSPALLRLAHIYEVGEDPIYSQPANITLADFIGFAGISALDERTLTAVHPVSFLAGRMSGFGGGMGGAPDHVPTREEGYVVTLQPTQIRTFFATLD